MSKIDLKYVTFNIPVKIDCPERLENVYLVIEYLQHHFDTNILVYEAASDGNAKIMPISGVQMILDLEVQGPFHRTKYLNTMAKISTTPVIVNYDCDILLPVSQIMMAADGCLNNQCDGCYPYNGLFVNVPRIHIPQIRKDMNMEFIDIVKTENFGTNSMGGAIFWNRAKFIEGGMENEHFISWGYEDWERLNRFKRLGYQLGRTFGALYHLSHPRGKDSCDGNPFYNHNGWTYDKIMLMNKEELRAYIMEQPWMN
jgi:hypothetical protein